MKKKLISLALSMLLLGVSSTGAFAYRISIDIWDETGTVLQWTTCALWGGNCLPTVIVRPEA
jgi:hypothetical protein